MFTRRWLSVILAGLALFVVLWFRSAQPLQADTIRKDGHITSDETWTTGNVYVIEDHVTVDTGVVLVVQAGAIIKFGGNAWLGVEGVLKVQGTLTNPVILTSLKDDSVGGDSNGDGNRTSPQSGDWASVIFFNSAHDILNIIEHASVRYGGRYDTFDPGVIVLMTSSPTLRYNIITRNRHGLVAWGLSSPTVVSNSVYRNDFYALYNGSTTSVIAAQHNWWGDASGPYDPSCNCTDPICLYNPDGRGGLVSDYVDYEPWAVLPPGLPSLNISATVFLPDAGRLINVTAPGGTDIGVAMPLSCQPLKVTTSLGNRNSLLLDWDGDGLWTGVISNTVTSQRTYTLTVTPTGGDCEPKAIAIAVVTLLPPGGRVYDGQTGAAIAGADVTVYRYDPALARYVIWDAYPYGQINPQLTNAGGHFAWDLPAGRYYLVAHKERYPASQTDPFDVPPPLSEVNIPLLPYGHHSRLPIIVR